MVGVDGIADGRQRTRSFLPSERHVILPAMKVRAPHLELGLRLRRGGRRHYGRRQRAREVREGAFVREDGERRRQELRQGRLPSPLLVGLERHEALRPGLRATNRGMAVTTSVVCL